MTPMPKFAANLTMMFNEAPFLERFGRARRAGFRGVEYLSPYVAEPTEIRARLDEHGLEQALYNTNPGNFEAGERGTAAVPGLESRFDADIDQALRYAETLRPGNIHIMAGRADGPKARETFVANLKKACAKAPSQGFVIEPINTRDMPGYFLTTTTQAKDIIAEVGAPNLKLQLDLYHCQIMEGDLTRRIEALAPLVAHVQIAAVPDRHEPDTGETNLGHLLSALDRVGYKGWIGCEYRPAGVTEDGLGWFAPYKEATS
jgi:hydroxypyruvate isomerase